MKKISGGNKLSCGHAQVLSDHRTKLANLGYNQQPVWCVECDTWSAVVPVDKAANDVLQ